MHILKAFLFFFTDLVCLINKYLTDWNNYLRLFSSYMTSGQLLKAKNNMYK